MATILMRPFLRRVVITASTVLSTTAGRRVNSAEQRFARYGLMYSGGDNIGTPNTSSGSFYYVPDVWMVVQTYLQIGTLGHRKHTLPWLVQSC
jgi:hypothetical protein